MSLRMEDGGMVMMARLMILTFDVLLVGLFHFIEGVRLMG